MITVEDAVLEELKAGEPNACINSVIGVGLGVAGALISFASLPVSGGWGVAGLIISIGGIYSGAVSVATSC